jgi:hypothetical protein
MDSPRKRSVVLAVVAGVVVMFFAGYIPGWLQARRAAQASEEGARRLAESQATLAKTQLDLEIARLRGRLGDVLHEANANNFGLAAQQATAFFNALQAAAANPQLAANPARRGVLEAILARRDEINADLARADQGVKAKLAETYVQFGRAIE